MNRYYADDDVFRRELSGNHCYPYLRTGTIKYLLAQYEMKRRKDERQELKVNLAEILSAKYETEHILPQHPAWELDEEEKATHQEIVHRLGNLTIASKEMEPEHEQPPLQGEAGRSQGQRAWQREGLLPQFGSARPTRVGELGEMERIDHPRARRCHNRIRSGALANRSHDWPKGAGGADIRLNVGRAPTLTTLRRLGPAITSVEGLLERVHATQCWRTPRPRVGLSGFEGAEPLVSPADTREAVPETNDGAVQGRGDDAVGDVAREVGRRTGRTLHCGGAVGGWGRAEKPLIGGGRSSGWALASLPSAPATSSAAVPFDPMKSGAFLHIGSDTAIMDV